MKLPDSSKLDERNLYQVRGCDSFGYLLQTLPALSNRLVLDIWTNYSYGKPESQYHRPQDCCY